MPLDPVEDLPSPVEQTEVDENCPEEELVVELDPRSAEVLEAYRTAKAAAKRWKESEEELRDELLELLGPAIGAAYGGRVVLRRSTREVWRVSSDALKDRYPDVWRSVRYMRPEQRLTILS
jgi:hypothetical protein